MAVIRSSRFILRPFKKGDEKSLVKHINDSMIFRNTIRIPEPYTLKEAKAWINKNIKEDKKKEKNQCNFVIDVGGEVVGSVGVSNIKDHQAEIGFWLARKYRNKGITTQAVKLLVDHCFHKLKLKRVYAHVFQFNKGSKKVLDKNNFNYEGTLKKNVKKRGKLLDTLLYAKLNN